MTQTRVVQIEAPGGPDAMKIVEKDVGEPGPGEVRIRHKACGLNFIDVYQRDGTYPLPLPAELGMEGAGVIEAVGEGVTHLKAGDRAAYASAPPGSYSDVRVMPAAQICPLPDAISFEDGAAMMLKGLTCVYLFERTTPLEAGDTILFHAAAGGVGLIACQWARAKGLTLIGTAGSDDKCQLALDNGATHMINYRTEDFVARTRELTAGKGVKVVMDAVGKDTWEGSLDCLQPFGMMISFGNSSGVVPPFAISALTAKGSLYLTRPTLFTHIADHERCQQMAQTLFGMVTSGKVEMRINQTRPLAEIVEAHRDLEARKTTGATVLIP